MLNSSGASSYEKRTPDFRARRTREPASSVYAAGDAAASGGPHLTPVAGYDGRIVASNLLNGNHAVVDYSVVPSVVFTIPALASVGLQEHEARERGLSFESHHEQTASWFAARRVGESAAGL